MKTHHLSHLSSGQQAILQYPQKITSSILRLVEMGMVRGSLVTYLRKAPLGDSIEISVHGARLCLSENDANHFVVNLIT